MSTGGSTAGVQVDALLEYRWFNCWSTGGSTAEVQAVPLLEYRRIQQ